MNFVLKKFNELNNDELYKILKLRVDVFVVEQNCPYEELDNKDQDALHLYLEDNNEIKAYLRILNEDEIKIGRVISTDRRKGYASILMNKAFEICKERFNKETIKIEAQVYAKEFYEKLGFKQSSNEFDLDGIKHIEMIKINS